MLILFSDLGGGRQKEAKQEKGGGLRAELGVGSVMCEKLLIVLVEERDDKAG